MKLVFNHLITLIPVVLLTLFSNSTHRAFPYIVSASSAETEVLEKTLYIDLSLNESFLAPNGACYLSYLDQSEETIFDLSLLEEGIYFASLPFDLLSKTDFDFTVKCIVPSEPTDSTEQTISSPEPIEYSSVLIQSNAKFSNSNINYLAIGKSEGFEYAPIEGFGFYGNRVPNPGANYTTQRVWISYVLKKPSVHAFGESPAVGYYNEDKWCIVDMISFADGSNNSLYYADIPVGITSIDFLMIASAKGHNYCIYSDVSIAALSYGSCYTIEGMSAVPVEINGAGANLLALVVSAYLTYGDAPSNGSVASTVSNLYNTWFANKSATQAELKQTTILDYTGYVANRNSYEGLEKKSSFSVNEKWNTLCFRAGIDPQTGEKKTISLSPEGVSKKVLLIFGAAIIGLSILLGVTSFLGRRYFVNR